MPGSGGNFLCRCLNLHPDIDCHDSCVSLNYEEKYQILNYQKINIQNNSKISINWIEFETINFIKPSKKNIKNILVYNHNSKNSEIRITTESKREFDWARYQALFKNTKFSLTWLKAGLIKNHDIGIPCSTLWNFEQLSKSLSTIEEYMQVTQNIPECRGWQKKLWEEWKKTWAPDNIKNTLDSYYYGPKI